LRKRAFARVKAARKHVDEIDTSLPKNMFENNPYLARV